MQDTKNAKKSPSRHHRTTLSGCIFATKACIDIRKKNLFNSNVSSTCPYNMVNFGPDQFRSLGHPCKFQRVSRFSIVTARHSSSGREPNFAVLNRGCHLYSAGRPSCWALAHILGLFFLFGCSLVWLLMHWHYWIGDKKGICLAKNVLRLSLKILMLDQSSLE